MERSFYTYEEWSAMPPVTETVVNSYLSHGEQAKTSIKGFCRADNWFGCLLKACWVQRKGVGWVVVLGTLGREKKVWFGGATQLRLLAVPLSKQMAQKVFSHWVIVVGYLGGHSIPQVMCTRLGFYWSDWAQVVSNGGGVLWWSSGHY